MSCLQTPSSRREISQILTESRCIPGAWPGYSAGWPTTPQHVGLVTSGKQALLSRTGSPTLPPPCSVPLSLPVIKTLNLGLQMGSRKTHKEPQSTLCLHPQTSSLRSLSLEIQGKRTKQVPTRCKTGHSRWRTTLWASCSEDHTLLPLGKEPSGSPRRKSHHCIGVQRSAGVTAPRGVRHLPSKSGFTSPIKAAQLSKQ